MIFFYKKNSTFPIDEVNLFFNELEIFVNNEARKLKLSGRLEKALLYEIIKTKIDPKTVEGKIDFHGYCAKYLIEIETGKRLTEKGTRFESGTITGIKSKFKLFVEFDKTLTFSKINIFFYKKFVNWLTEKDMMPNSIGTVIKVLKTVLNLAVADGYEVDPIFHKFKVHKEIGTSGIALTEIELQKFREVELDGYLDNARNVFLLGCETGLRFGDYSVLNDKATKGRDLHVIQKKTKAKVIIPINAEIMRLLSLNLRVISNQKLNEYIKEVAKLVFKDETVLIGKVKGGEHKQGNILKKDLISSHVARRTFATLAYKKGIPSLAIMAITGHKTEKSFLTYIKVSQQEQADIFRRYIQ